MPILNSQPRQGAGTTPNSRPKRVILTVGKRDGAVHRVKKIVYKSTTLHRSPATFSAMAVHLPMRRAAAFGLGGTFASFVVSKCAVEGARF